MQTEASNFKMFVDIGGDRMTSVVCQALILLNSFWSGSAPQLQQPSLVVVKSEGLAAAAALHCDSESSICDLLDWWPRCARPPPSTRQRKKRAHTALLLRQRFSPLES